MPAQQHINDIFKTITSAVDAFDNSVPAIQQQMLDEVSLLLRDLDLASGRIAPSVANLRTVAKAQGKLERIVLENKEYKNQVASYMDDFGKISDLNAGYFTELESKFKPSSLLKEMEKQSISATVDSLTGAGISSNVADPVYDLIRQNVTTGTKYTDLVKSLSNYIKGQGDTLGGLDRYVKQITTDALNQFSANYMEIAASDLGLKWYQYSGVRIETSRKFCVGMMRKKHYHKVEIPDLIKGRFPQFKAAGGSIYQNTGLPHGMVKGTNVENFQIYRGGYNCQHQAIPVAESSVPAKTRKTVYRKYNIPMDEKGFADKGASATPPARKKPAATPAVKLGGQKKYDAFMDGINPNAARLVMMKPKPRKMRTTSKSGAYYQPETVVVDGDVGELVMGINSKKGVFRHEYGHHLDFTWDLKKAGNNATYRQNFVRSVEDDFVDAIKKDDRHRILSISKKAKEAGISTDDYYRKIAGTWNKKGYAAPSDVMDALMEGRLFDDFGGVGHGSSYYRLYKTDNWIKSAKSTEIFANMFEGYSTGGKLWAEMQEYYPNISKLFAEIIENEIK